MQLPPFPAISPATLRALAERHHLGARRFELQPSIGICNAIYFIGDDLVLRVPREADRFTALVRKEAVVIPRVRAVGIRTPELVAFDDALDLLPVPYALFERVHGLTLGTLDLEPDATPAIWRILGHELALLHSGLRDEAELTEIPSADVSDLRHRPAEMAREGYFSAVEARWLEAWLDQLAPAALAPQPRRFLHGDTQGTNILVRAGTLDYLALLDWGDARWGDAALDFAGMPLRAVPFVLEGYREMMPLDDESIEARILWRHLQFALSHVCRGPQPGLSWAERPLSMLLEIVRFCMSAPNERWSALLPR